MCHTLHIQFAFCLKLMVDSVVSVFVAVVVVVAVVVGVSLLSAAPTLVSLKRIVAVRSLHEWNDWNADYPAC